MEQAEAVEELTLEEKVALMEDTLVEALALAHAAMSLCGVICQKAGVPSEEFEVMVNEALRSTTEATGVKLNAEVIRPGDHTQH